MDYYSHALLIVEPESGVFIDDGVTADDLFQAVVKSTGITPFYVSIPPGGRNGGQGNFPSYINFLTTEQRERAGRTLGASLDIGGRVYDIHIHGERRNRADIYFGALHRLLQRTLLHANRPPFVPAPSPPTPPTPTATAVLAVAGGQPAEGDTNEKDADNEVGAEEQEQEQEGGT